MSVQTNNNIFSGSIPTVIQWNCKSFPARKQDIKLLIQKFQPIAICFQETRLTPKMNINGFNNYNFYRKDFTEGRISCSGVMLMIHKKYFSQPIPVTSNFQVVAARVKIPGVSYDITLCSIYCRPDLDKITEIELRTITAQLPQPYMICADFNAHNVLWGGDRINENGLQIENFLINNDVILMNSNNQHTHVNFSYGITSPIDLTLCSQSIAVDFDWAVADDLHSSDHFPLIIKYRNFHNTYTGPEKNIWIFKKAKWAEYQEAIIFQDDKRDFSNVNSSLEKINRNILEAADKYIPKLNLQKCKRYVPWWCDKVKEAVEMKKRALKAFRRNPIPINFIEFKRCRAITRKIIREQQEKSWDSFIESIEKPLTVNDMWAQLRKVKGKKQYNPIAGLKNAASSITSDKSEISEILADFYERNSDDIVYDENFVMFKRSFDFTPPMNTDNIHYNLPFSYAELIATFKNCRSAAAGVDGISYQLIIQLPEAALRRLLDFFNYIWKTGQVPTLWNTALIIPILKPGKDSSVASNYRPISLLCCMNKIFEKMISKRLKWIIEDKQMVDYYQNGNRRQRSTMDNLIQLEHEVITALQNHEHVVAICLDINKFFDRVSKVAVLSKLIDKNIGGPMFHYINNFMTNPQIKVSVDGIISSSRVLANGIRQGSSLSGDLSNIATCNFAQCIPKEVTHGMFVDDIIIYMRSRDSRKLEATLQLTLDNIHNWSKYNGFTFSPEKTIGITFSRLRNKPIINLFFQNHRIKFEETVRYLGLYLDDKWTWGRHIKEIKSRSIKALNIMKILGGRRKGLSRRTLLRLYNAYVLPILDYGSIVYGSAKIKELEKLNVVHHTALRIATGAFRTSPIVSLLAESGQPTLQTRRNIRCINYISNVARNPNHPCYLLLFNQRLEIVINSTRYPLNIRHRAEAMEDYKLVTSCVLKKECETPQWLVPQVNVHMLISAKKKDAMTQEILIRYNEFKNMNRNKVLCFTDGSKLENYTGGAYLLNGTIKQFQLNSIASIYTAELIAIQLCVSDILTSLQDDYCFRDFVICSDSKSSLQALKSNCNSSILVEKILNQVKEISTLGSQVSFLWLPSHSGIKENDMVDKAARSPNNCNFLNYYTFSDYKAHFKSLLYKRWENEWRQETMLGRQLRRIKTDVRAWKSSHRKNRFEEVVICRLRIGHSLATHKYLMDKTDPLTCEFCGQSPIYIDHWFIQCRALANLRQKHKLATSITYILKDNSEAIDKCLRFLYHTKLFTKI